jgi:guanylate kinase
VGKATILSQLLKQVPGLALVKSLTSRSPRPDDGTLGKYVYVTPAEFESLVNQHQLLEWATVHGHYYGTLESAFEEAKRSGKDPILEIDVQGAMNLKALHPEAVLIFVAPPDQQALVDRLRSRSSESEEERLVRLKDAERELSQAKEFDHMVINDRLETAVEEIEAIIANERLKAETVS